MRRSVNSPASPLKHWPDTVTDYKCTCSTCYNRYTVLLLYTEESLASSCVKYDRSQSDCVPTGFDIYQPCLGSCLKAVSNLMEQDYFRLGWIECN